jgi:hypothetical protein
MPKNYEAIGKLVSYMNNGYSESDCSSMGYNQTDINEAIERIIMHGNGGITYRCKECGCKATRVNRVRMCKACEMKVKVSR